MGVRRRLADFDKAREAKPTWKQIESRWPGSVVTHADGTKEANIPLAPDTAEGRRNRSDLLDLVGPSARLETDDSLERAATTDHKEIVETKRARSRRRARPGVVLSHGVGPWWERKCREAAAKGTA